MKYCEDGFKAVCLLAFASAWNTWFFSGFIATTARSITVWVPTLKTGNPSWYLHLQDFFYDTENLDGYRSRNGTNFQSTEHTKQLWKWNAADQTHFSLLLLQGCMYFCDNANRNPNQSNGWKERQQTKHFPVRYCFRETCILVLITYNK